MTLLTWNHACSVGVRAMDDQHGILMDTLNELRQAVMQGAGREPIVAQILRLIEFTRMHFVCEEALLARHEFPGVSAHRTEHDRLLARLEEAAQRAQHGKDGRMRALLDFLRDWFIEHIVCLDREYGAWLNERGIH